MPFEVPYIDPSRGFRVVMIINFTSVDPYKFPYAMLQTVPRRIFSEWNGLCRVTSRKPCFLSRF